MNGRPVGTNRAPGVRSQRTTGSAHGGTGQTSSSTRRSWSPAFDAGKLFWRSSVGLWATMIIVFIGSVLIGAISMVWQVYSDVTGLAEGRRAAAVQQEVDKDVAKKTSEKVEGPSLSLPSNVGAYFKKGNFNTSDFEKVPERERVALVVEGSAVYLSPLSGALLHGGEDEWSAELDIEHGNDKPLYGGSGGRKIEVVQQKLDGNFQSSILPPKRSPPSESGSIGEFHDWMYVRSTNLDEPIIVWMELTTFSPEAAFARFAGERIMEASDRGRAIWVANLPTHIRELPVYWDVAISVLPAIDGKVTRKVCDGARPPTLADTLDTYDLHVFITKHDSDEMVFSKQVSSQSDEFNVSRAIEEASVHGWSGAGRLYIQMSPEWPSHVDPPIVRVAVRIGGDKPQI